MSLEAIIAIVVALFGGGGFLYGRKRAQDAARAQAAARSAQESQKRAEERHTVGEIIDRKAEQKKIIAEAVLAAAVAKADAKVVQAEVKMAQVNAAEKKGNKALSELLNDDIRNNWKDE